MNYEFLYENCEEFDKLMATSNDETLYSAEFSYAVNLQDELSGNEVLLKRFEECQKSGAINNPKFMDIYQQYMKTQNISDRIVLIKISDINEYGYEGGYLVTYRIKGNVNIKTLLEIMSTVSGFDMKNANDIFCNYTVWNLKLTEA